MPDEGLEAAPGRVVVGIDTCTRWLGLALLDRAGGLVGQVHERVETHTTRLVSALEAMLSTAGVPRGRIAAVGAVRGPGSFTGLRVGLAAAEGLSLALGVPAFGLDSLTALAMASAQEGEGVSLLDARRSQVYCRPFLNSGGATRALGEPQAMAPAEVPERFDHTRWAIGDGVPLVPRWPPDCTLVAEVPNLAIPAARHALRLVAAGEAGTDLEPLYVRAPDARLPGAV